MLRLKIMADKNLCTPYARFNLCLHVFACPLKYHCIQPEVCLHNFKRIWIYSVGAAAIRMRKNVLQGHWQFASYDNCTLENHKIGHLSNVWPIFAKFGTVMLILNGDAYRITEPNVNLKFITIEKNCMACRCNLKNREITSKSSAITEWRITQIWQ